MNYLFVVTWRGPTQCDNENFKLHFMQSLPYTGLNSLQCGSLHQGRGMWSTSVSLASSFLQGWARRKGTRYYLSLLWSRCSKLTLGNSFVGFLEIAPVKHAIVDPLTPAGFFPHFFLSPRIPMDYPSTRGHHTSHQPIWGKSPLLDYRSAPSPSPQSMDLFFPGNTHPAPAIILPLTTVACSLSSLAFSPSLLQATLATAFYTVPMPS